MLTLRLLLFSIVTLLPSLAQASDLEALMSLDWKTLNEKVVQMNEQQLENVYQQYLDEIEKANTRRNDKTTVSTNNLCLKDKNIYQLDAIFTLLDSGLEGERLLRTLESVREEHHRIVGTFTPLPDFKVGMSDFDKNIHLMKKRDQEIAFSKTKISKDFEEYEKRAVESLMNLTVCEETYALGSYALAFVETNGWPDMRVVGKASARNFRLFVQHFDSAPQKQMEFLPILRQAVAEGKATPKGYAYLYDRVMVNAGKKQRFGTQLVQGCGVKPLENPQRVDDFRAEMEMETLGSYLSWVPNCFGADIEDVITKANIKTTIPISDE